MKMNLTQKIETNFYLENKNSKRIHFFSTYKEFQEH